MSTDLIVYLNYMANWENQSEILIQQVIDEQKLFKNLGDFESDSAVDEEFNTLVSMAKKVRDETISADTIQMAADVAAVAAFWSFGLSMAAFATLEATEEIMKKFISSKSEELNEKLKTTDIDIASKINSDVYRYMETYKKNNTVISDQSPKGLDLRHARANLMQFMAQVDKRYKGKGGLSVSNFKQLAASARLAFNSPEITKVYDALDELNLSKKSKGDVKKFVDTLKGLTFPKMEILQLVQGISLLIGYHKMNITRETIQESAKEAGIPAEEVEVNAFEMMDAVGKFAVGAAVVMSVVDVVMNIIDMVEIVEQTKKMVNELNDTIRPSYKQYFDEIKNSAKSYNKAISEK